MNFQRIVDWILKRNPKLDPLSSAENRMIEVVWLTYEEMADEQNERIVEEVYARVMRELRTSQKLLPLLPPEIKFGEFSR